MRQALENMERGLAIDHHVFGRSQSGGFAATILAMRQRGWIAVEPKGHLQAYVLTDAGREVLAQERQRPVRRRHP